MGATKNAAAERTPCLARLIADLGADVVTDGAAVEDRYLVDWSGEYRGRALALARPRSTAEAARVIALAHALGVPVTPQGGHTGLVRSGSPTGSGTELIVSLERMTRIRQIEPLSGFAIVEAGAVLADFKAGVASEGAYFPLTLGAEGSCRIGGNIATNAGGVNVVRYGMARDLTLGLEVVLPDGRVIADLRGLRKNNTGYDWKQLFIGAEGTLGLVTATCLKIFPRPTQVETLWLAATDTAGVMAVFRRMREIGGDLLSAFELIEADAIDLTFEKTGVPAPPTAQGGAYALVELSAVGGPPLRPWLIDALGAMLAEGLLIDGVLAETVAQANQFWRLREAIVEAQALCGPHLRTDVSVPIGRMPEFLADAHAVVEKLAPGARSISYGHVGDGNIHFNVVRGGTMDQETFAARIGSLGEAVDALIDRHGGSISAEHGIGIAKRRAHAVRTSPAALDVCRAIKYAFDPTNSFGPGRIFEQTDQADAP